MSTPASSLSYGRRQPGFTLVEVLFMVIILLVGVVAVIRIFPPGFEAINETQQATLAQQQVENILTGFEEHPESLPDAILPLDNSVWESASYSAVAFTCFPDDLTAVEYNPAAGDWDWFGKHTYPSIQRWPLWQPLHTRIMRRVVGEKVVIPSEIGESGGQNYAFLPKYIPRFGPIQANSLTTSDTSSLYDMNDAARWVVLYDLRYRKVTADQFSNLNSQENLAHPFYYRATYRQPDLSGEDAFYFPPIGTNEGVRDIRAVFSCVNLTTSAVVSVPTTVWSFPDAATTSPAYTIGGQALILAVSVDTTGIKVSLPSGWKLVPGSEQFNRAYHFDDTTPAYSLPSGHYYMPPPPGSQDDDQILFSPIIFSKEDSGRTVKIDYTVADWNILHEDVTVDDEGYITLSFGVPKIRNKPNVPREPITLGLYRPMQTSGDSVVMGLVDLSGGVPYHILYNQASATPYAVDMQVGATPANQMTAVDFDQAQSGRMRLGGMTAGNQDWHKLRGMTFRIYYRVQRDVTMQVYRAPATFWFRSYDNTAPTQPLQWDMFTLNPVANDGGNGNRFYSNTVYLPSVYMGQTVAVDYAYWNEYGRSIDEPTVDTMSGYWWVPLQSVSKIRNGNTYLVINSDINPVTGMPTISPNGVLGTVTVEDKDTVGKRILVSGVIGSNIHAGAYFIENVPTTPPYNTAFPLQKAYGEIHTITDLDASGNAVITLRHLPSAKAHLAVRGVSVTVRALWTQPRRGYAYTLGQQPGALTWQGKWRDWNPVANAAVNYTPNQVTTWNGMTFRATAAGAANADNQPGVGSNWMTYWERFPALRPLNERWRAVTRTAVLSATRE